MDTTKLLSNSAYQDALYGWEPVSEKIRLGQKIRITFDGIKPKTGYAYKEEGSWLGIRYTWRSNRWWSLLNYNNPLNKLEVEEDGNYVTLWERG